MAELNGSAQVNSDGVIPKGQRNAFMTQLASHLSRWDIYPEGVLLICKLTNKISCEPPLDNEEVEQIVNPICGVELR